VPLTNSPLDRFAAMHPGRRNADSRARRNNQTS